jgi:hypothetical protein
MDWFTNSLKTIKEQSPYYNLAFAIVCCFILLLPIFFSTATLDKIPEIIAWRQKYMPYISIVFVILCVFGGGQVIKKVADVIKRKKQLSKLRKEKQSLLSQLDTLYKQSQEQFKTQESCIQWSNKVAPLLQFNSQYYANFLSSSHRINIKGISGIMAKSLVNIMKSQLEMAIEELKNDLENT